MDRKDKRYIPKDPGDYDGLVCEEEWRSGLATELGGLEKIPAYGPRLRSEVLLLEDIQIRNAYVSHSIKRPTAEYPDGRKKCRFVFADWKTIMPWFKSIMYLVSRTNMDLVTMIAGLHGLEFRQGDIKMAYVYTPLKPVNQGKWYFTAPRGWTWLGKIMDSPKWLWMLFVNLYGGVFSGHDYGEKVNFVFIDNGWQRAASELALHTYINELTVAFNISTVDDMGHFTNDMASYEHMEKILDDAGYELQEQTAEKIILDGGEVGLRYDYTGNDLIRTKDAYLRGRYSACNKFIRVVEEEYGVLIIKRAHFWPLPAHASVNSVVANLAKVPDGKYNRALKKMIKRLQKITGGFNWLTGGAYLTIKFGVYLCQRAMHLATQYHLDIALHIATHLKWYNQWCPMFEFPSAEEIIRRGEKFEAWMQSDASHCDDIKSGDSTVAIASGFGTVLINHEVYRDRSKRLCSTTAEIAGLAKSQRKMVGNMNVLADLGHYVSGFEAEGDNFESLRKQHAARKTMKLRYTRIKDLWARSLEELGIRKGLKHIPTKSLRMFTDKWTKNDRSVGLYHFHACFFPFIIRFTQNGGLQSFKEELSLKRPSWDGRYAGDSDDDANDNTGRCSDSQRNIVGNTVPAEIGVKKNVRTAIAGGKDSKEMRSSITASDTKSGTLPEGHIVRGRDSA